MKGKKYYFHVHVIAYGCDEHTKQLLYKKYMLENAIAREEYEATKKAILSSGFKEQDAYGKQKSPFLKSLLESIE